jgi:hypothetical protein
MGNKTSPPTNITPPTNPTPPMGGNVTTCLAWHPQHQCLFSITYFHDQLPQTTQQRQAILLSDLILIATEALHNRHLKRQTPEPEQPNQNPNKEQNSEQQQ